MQTQLTELRQALSRATERGTGGLQMKQNSEAAKRLDRWATSPADAPYQGIDGKTTLREWTRLMKEQAGYCDDILRVAMEKCERSPDEVTVDKLAEWNVDDISDRALRMAIMTKTSGIAKQLVENNREVHPG